MRNLIVIASVLVTLFSSAQNEYIPGRLHKSKFDRVVGIEDYMHPNVGHMDGERFQVYVNLFEVGYNEITEDNIEAIFNEAKRMLKLNGIPLDGYAYDWSTFGIDLNKPDYADIQHKVLSGERVSFGWVSMIDSKNGFGIGIDIDKFDWKITLQIDTFDVTEK